MKAWYRIRKFVRDESGQDLLEYALVMATVLAAVVAGSNGIATDITSALSTITVRIMSSVG